MSKFNQPKNKSAGSSPIQSDESQQTTTYEGATAYGRSPQSELFLLGVTNFVSEKTFYEPKRGRDDRFRNLVHTIAREDGGGLWLAGFIPWLRRDANMRSAPVVAAAEYAYAWTRGGRNVPSPPVPGDRRGTVRFAVDGALNRADEPGEAAAYYAARYGKQFPMPFKRGLADGARRLYTQASTLKYDTGSRGFRFGDVLELMHPRPIAEDHDEQNVLFHYLLDRRHGKVNSTADIHAMLTMIRSRSTLEAVPVDQRRALLTDPALTARLQEAGATWEFLSGWMQTEWTAKTWEAIIPSMGYMALLRNLRNFDETGVSDSVAESVAAGLSNRIAVENSRQLPYRFLSAYDALSSTRWLDALSKALDYSVQNVPTLPGRTLVLVDTSGSMDAHVSDHSTVTRMESGALFGIALAAQGQQADLYGFADGTFHHHVPQGASILKVTSDFIKRGGEAGHGTQMASAIRNTYKNHDRVVIISDLQAFEERDYYWYGYDVGNVTDAVPSHIPIYAFNTAGYAQTIIDNQPNRYELGGLTDATFKMIPMLECGENCRWPWEYK